MGGSALQDAARPTGGEPRRRLEIRAQANTALTLEHTWFRWKCDESEKLTDYGAVLPRGMRLASYRLLRPLRDCQTGSAFVALRRGVEGFEKQVVLYCSKRERLDEMAREASRAARLSHAGIAHVLDLGVQGDIAFVATEHVPGNTLRASVLRHGRLPWRDVARAVAEAALALAYAHGRRGDDGRLLGIMHGRLSPGRVTIDPAGCARITGLGVSWAWPDHLGFGAPEEMRGEPVDGRADVFALGTILGRCTDERALPDPVANLVARATQALPEHRSTAAELHDTLAVALRDAEPAAAE